MFGRSIHSGGMPLEEEFGGRLLDQALDHLGFGPVSDVQTSCPVNTVVVHLTLLFEDLVFELVICFFAHSPVIATVAVLPSGIRSPPSISSCSKLTFFFFFLAEPCTSLSLDIVVIRPHSLFVFSTFPPPSPSLVTLLPDHHHHHHHIRNTCRLHLLISTNCIQTAQLYLSSL